jgi:hypothetical protein
LDGPIAGSVGRCTDFTRTFLLCQARWPLLLFR